MVTDQFLNVSKKFYFRLPGDIQLKITIMKITRATTIIRTLYQFYVLVRRVGIPAKTKKIFFACLFDISECKIFVLLLFYLSYVGSLKHFSIHRRIVDIYDMRM